MFKLLRSFFASIVAVVGAAWVVPGISYQGDFRVLLAASLVFALFFVLVHPILSAIISPLDFFTFGLASAALSVGFFYAISYVVPAFTITAFTFEGLSFAGVSLPQTFIPRYGTVILGSVVASLVFSFLNRDG